MMHRVQVVRTLRKCGNSVLVQKMEPVMVPSRFQDRTSFVHCSSYWIIKTALSSHPFWLPPQPPQLLSLGR